METTCHWLLISASGQWQFFLQDLAFCARKTNPCQFDVLSLHLSSWVLPSRWYSPSHFCNHPFTHPSVLLCQIRTWIQILYLTSKIALWFLGTLKICGSDFLMFSSWHRNLIYALRLFYIYWGWLGQRDFKRDKAKRGTCWPSEKGFERICLCGLKEKVPWIFNFPTCHYKKKKSILSPS